MIKYAIDVEETVTYRFYVEATDGSVARAAAQLQLDDSVAEMVEVDSSGYTVVGIWDEQGRPVLAAITGGSDA